ncbi:MAG TPA: LamG-like jellyroll fold domain-containing protein, partial [Methylomirabilota bacterium]|nr:LamG-like jellyroll fold domain-containing protein [Methylomirabilota bacterium]
QSLAAFNGKSMRGDWRLRVRDVFPGDAGTLNAWRLQLGRAPVLTATNGTYVFTNLGATTFYTVRPLASGFVFVPPSRRVQAGSTNVDFSVVSGVIAGRVTDGGAGVGGVTVSAGAASATTDAGGFYQLTGLPPGNYALNAALTGFGLAPASQNVPLGATNANFAIASYPVSGRIVDLATNGAPGVTVSIGALSAVTDNDGRYLIAQVPPGARVVTPSRGAALFNPASRSLNVNAALTGVDFILASAPPTISDLRDRVIARGTSTGAIRFDVNDTETRAARLVLTAASSDTSIVPPGGIVFGGVGNARTVTITPPPDRSGVVTITVTVTDESGLTASDSFTLRVNTAPLAGLGSALSFDGVNDAVLVPTNVIANKGNFTFECWAFAPSNAGPRAIAEQGGGTNFFSLSVDAAGLIRVGPWNTGVPFPFGNWRHIAVVKETTNARLYLDGVLRASRGSTIPLPAQSNRFDIGRSAAGQFWLGALDDLRVWEVSRTAAEIATNLNARLLGTETNLTALWRFDERSGTNAFDATPGARHGNVSGAAWVQSGARFDRYFTAEDVGFSDVLQAFDPDGDPLTFRLVTPAAQGTMTLTGTNTGAFTYTPAPNVSGEDRFTFSVSDGFVDSEISLLTVSMAPDTNAPVIELNFTVSPPYPEDSYPGVGFPFTVRDVETPPSNIVVTLFSSDPALVPVERLFFETEDLDTGARTLRVPPATNQSGTATIFIVADDGRQRATNSFEVTITPVNDVPFVSALTNQLTRRGVATAPQPFTFADVDTPVDNVTLSGAMNSGDLSLPANISVTGTGTNRAVTMTPVANRSGSVGISVLADDGVGGIGSSRYTVTVNDPPTIALTPVQSTFRNTPTRPIAITLGDVDDAVAGLTLSATSSNPALIPDNAFSFGGSGANRTLVVSPALGQFGVATITVTVRDPHWTVSTNLTLFVEQGLDYTFAELPTLPGHLSGQAESINDAGLAVGRSQPDEDDSAGIAPRRAVVWNTATSVPTVSTLNTLDAGPSWALAINQAGQIVGTRFGPSASAPNTGGSRAWVFRNGVATDLAFTLGVFNRGEGHDLNDSGVVVGATNSLAGQSFVFDGATATNLLRFRFDFDLDNIELVINNAGDLAGIATNAAARRTLLVQGDGTVRDLFARLGGTENNPSDINNVGEILGDVRIPTGVLKYPYIYNYRTDTLNTNLHTALAAIGLVQDYDTHEINDSGEAVGSAEDAAGTQYAWLYSDGRAYNLQDFVSPGVFRPKQARGINNAGDIVGVGRRPGDRDDRPFVMRRQWLVGQ